MSKAQILKEIKENTPIGIDNGFSIFHFTIYVCTSIIIVGSKKPLCSTI
jgi:hypothetical protein